MRTLLFAGFVLVPVAFDMLLLVLYGRVVPRSQRITLVVLALLWLAFSLYLVRMLSAGG